MDREGLDKAVEDIVGGLERAERDDVKAMTAGLLHAARSDCEACATLYGARSFALSTFHLQQAVEKATKAYLLYTGLITPSELRRKIGHDSLRGHTLLATRMLKHLASIYGNDSGYGQALDKLDAANDINYDELASISYDGICSILAFYDAYVARSVETAEELGRLSDREYLASAMKGAGFDGAINDETTDAFARAAGGKDKASLVDVGSVLPFLFVASVVTSPHEASTRYPDGHLKPEDYTEEMGIVRAAPELVGRLGKALDLMGRFVVPLGPP